MKKQKIQETLGVADVKKAKAIKTLRSCAGFTQLQMAALCGVGRGYLGLLETVREPLPDKTAAQICRALGIPLSTIHRLADVYNLSPREGLQLGATLIDLFKRHLEAEQ